MSFDDIEATDHSSLVLAVERISSWAAAERLFHSSDDDAGSPYSSFQFHHS
jgi:hypothetical protein